MARRSTGARRRIAVAAGALVAGTVLVTAPAGNAVAEQTAVGTEAAAPVNWGKCPDGSLNRVPPDQRHLFTCATYAVPLDHQHPRLGSIDLALMRRAATDQQNRIGSLFLNPGGPGGSGWSMPTAGTSIFEPEVLTRFDLIGFDPRGVARSAPVRCFKTKEEADAVFGRMSSVPLTKADIEATMDAYADYSGYCARNAGPLLAHMSTEDVARDLDLLRGAVGDRKLTYVGFSYGTLLGATYANMFPKQSRALILDGNVDPKLRTSNGTQYDRERAAGFELALDAFLKRCDAEGAKCAFSDGDPRAKFDEIRDRVRQGPLPLPDGSQLTIDSFTGAVGSTLYNPAALKGLAEELQLVYQLVNPGQAAAKATTRSATTLLGKQGTLGRLDIRPDAPYESDDSYLAVNCTDKPFLKVPQIVPSIAAFWERESPTFGRYQAFSDLAACATWPLRHPDAYRGPWHRKTETPVLVIGNYYDPATQYEFSKRMADQLGNARLVSVDAFGHCILGDSSCADKIAARYLIDLEVPKPGQVCLPDQQPF